MVWHLPLVLAAPRMGGVALVVVLGIVGVGLGRRVNLRGGAKIGIAIGAVLLAMAAGQPIFNRAGTGSVAVMVDLSPSTRGATFRDRTALLYRIHQLLGQTPYQLLGFGDHNQALPEGLSDLPCERTVFAPPVADAVLLFSDGQFELPAWAPPTYSVIDPALDHPADAAVTELRHLGQQVLGTVRNNGRPRTLHWSGAVAENPSDLKGDFTQLARPVGSGEISADLSPGDLWPENDSLSIAPNPPTTGEQWWIGAGVPGNWQAMDPANLPVDSADYLRPAVIVLNNIPAEAISSVGQQRLVQYVRDLGGALVIAGGDHAFASGDYDGSGLDDLSPLASSPPQPGMQWILLVDASGSMAGDGSVPSPWQREVSAMTGLLPRLPRHDAVSIGSFAESLNWWSTGKSAEVTLHRQLPPVNVVPSGPTNLAAALSQIAASADGSVPAQLLLMTDADAELPDPGELAAQLAARKIHLHLLAIGHGGALAGLREIASVTGGSVLEQLDAGRWVGSAGLLLRSALPRRYEHRPIEIGPPPHAVSEWNQTWMKSTAIELEKSSESTMSAQWQMGLGKVIGVAYPADAGRIQGFAAKIAATPSDPRFSVSWTAGSTLKIEVNAIDRDHYLNGESIRAEMLDPQSGEITRMPILQSSPGQYVLSVPAPRASQLVTIRHGAEVLKRFAIAGRYPSEFDAIGNDRENLQILAQRTGGAVIDPGPARPIHFGWPVRQTAVTSEIAFAGFAVIGLGLIWNRRRG